MKKRKTYEISVIDKTYSKIISDETKFYTSDTALELAFELKETEYNFESAEIVLLNIDDRSLTTRPVSKVNNDFVYEIDDDITTHYGEWRGQLMLVEKGEVHVSSPIKFRIENDLYSNKPLEITEVVSWVSLKKYANVLVDELKQAVDEAVAKVETMDETFKANELDRDAAEKERQSRFEVAESEREKGESIRVDTFNANETARQNTFETNEIERDKTFNANEDIRQMQELEREEAESQRQTVFDENEAVRTETFNTNEAKRQENEESRELAENERENSEAQRKTDHANRSAELAGKADKIVLNNLVENGDFSNNEISDNFVISTSLQESATINDGKLVLKPKTFAWNNYIKIISPQNIGDKIYCRFTIDSPIATKVDWRVGGVTRAIPYGPGESTISFVNTVSSVNGYMYLFTQDFTENMVIKLDNVTAINLTKTFGVGNEPTKEEIDRLIEITGYIDGEYALNNKEMLTWTLALIRRNKNAIVTLGGA